MYRHGLGDCFLLAFGVTKVKQKYMLVDCGVLLGTDDADSKMESVVKDIRQATGDHLDVLVVTHEHWDHVSGFIQAKTNFAKIAVDQVWYAWTEDPRNPLARELRVRRRAALHGLRLAIKNAAAAPPLFAKRIESVNAFFGPDLGATGRATTEDALNWVKEQWKNHHYCVPGGKPLKIDGLPDVHFYILGPPADSSFIRKSRPSKGQVYLDDANSGQLGFYLTALNAESAIQRSEKRRFKPFNEAYNLESYDQDALNISNLYQQEPWRQIDTDWTGAAGELALRLDAHTNNTSLVMAIELGQNNKVLLFAADAQVGNWLSWDTVKWGGDFEEVTADNLLSRTVLYKVGHHGSHNATLREKGLEQMTNSELSAFIPVNREMARRMHWRMPHEPLFKRLQEKTLGRVVLSDAGLKKQSSDTALDNFRKNCFETELYIDYKVTKWKDSKLSPKKRTVSKATATKRKKSVKQPVR
jgi:beta-lactamase superfamily II metal-dependent hydrolase